MKLLQVKWIIEEKIALLLLCEWLLLAEVWRSGVKSVPRQHLAVLGQICNIDLPEWVAVKKEGQRTGIWSGSVTHAGQRAWSNNELRVPWGEDQSAEGCVICPCHGDQHRYSGSWRMQGLVFRYCAVNRMWGFLEYSVMLSDFSSRFWFKARKTDVTLK